MKQLITIGLSPNVELDDVWLASRTLVQPWRYQHGDTGQALTAALAANWPDAAGTYLLNSGRSALLLFLRALHLSAGAEVLLQAFTCNAVVNPILWAGLRPVFVDIEDDHSYTMSATDLERKITPHNKVLIIQHTFGRSARLTALMDIARRHHLIVIEDCAHALGTRYQGKPVGSFGDAAIFSFGRDKVISCVYGGALVVNNHSHRAEVEKLYTALPYPSRLWIIQQLIHPGLTKLAVRLWFMANIGRGLFWLAQRGHIISLAVSRGERMAQKPDYFPTRLPNALAQLALQQWKKLERFNEHRRHIAALYQAALRPGQPLAESIYLRYTWRTSDPKKLAKQCAAAGIILGDWYWSVIAPDTTDLPAMQYQPGSCPVAERLVQECINLPTHINITPTIARMIIKHIQQE